MSFLYLKNICVFGGTLFLFLALFSKLWKVFKGLSWALCKLCQKTLASNETWLPISWQCSISSILSHWEVIYKAHEKDCNVSHLMYTCIHPVYYVCSWGVTSVSKYLLRIMCSVSPESTRCITDQLDPYWEAHHARKSRIGTILVVKERGSGNGSMEVKWRMIWKEQSRKGKSRSIEKKASRTKTGWSK